MPIDILKPRTFAEASEHFQNKYVPLITGLKVVHIKSGCTVDDLGVKRMYDNLHKTPELQQHFICVKATPIICKKLFRTFARKSFKENFEPHYFYMYADYKEESSSEE